ncbi:MAG: ORF6N domain-containing protein [Firmicutes bacterium]|nr:ORF6N domain-containing protein [Bacillota bacterium]
MSELAIKEVIEIENMIYEVRGIQVMLDSDLARLYKCKGGTKVINQAVKRNIERFPEDFYFQLTYTEYLNLKSQFVTSSLNNNYGGIRKLPYVFTEQGVAMLATVLRTEIASYMSVSIMRAFVKMRSHISNSLIEQKYINDLVLEDHRLIKENTTNIKLLKESFDKLESNKKMNEIYFNGQIFDAYSKIYEIFKSTIDKLIIIDAYADNTILDIIKRLNIEVIIITKKNNLLTKQDINKYSKQYNNLKVYYNDTFHDRYFIIDKEEVYHCGASINKIGYKTFSITLIKDNDIIRPLIEKINNIINV